jgi:hypothetical protein
VIPARAKPRLPRFGLAFPPYGGEAVQDATHAIRVSANELHPGQTAGEHSEHHKDMPQDLLAAREKVGGSGD